MLAAGNSNTSTARGSKKLVKGLSPTQHEASSSKKDNIIDNLRKKPTMGEMKRGYDTNPSVSSSINGLSKSIVKEKYH